MMQILNKKSNPLPLPSIKYICGLGNGKIDGVMTQEKGNNA